LLERFSTLINDSVAQIHNLIFRNRNLRQTRDHLLPKLISGEVDVEAVASMAAGPAAETELAVGIA
jgi:hypothetical protein